jgi:hypothetical protein
VVLFEINEQGVKQFLLETKFKTLFRNTIDIELDGKTK